MRNGENPMTAAHTDVRISVADFGPIETGTVDLRPLTVFVGPSNTGKTYFAILIYALHRIMEGFPRLPWLPSNRHYFYWERASESERVGSEVRTDEFQNVLEKLDTPGRPFRFSELSKSMRDIAHSALRDSGLLRKSMETEIKRCFDIESVHDLVRLSDVSPEPASGIMKLSLAVGEENRDLWSFNMRISESGVNTDGRIEDMVLLPEGWSPSEFAFARLFNGFRRGIKEIPGTDSRQIPWYLFQNFVEELLELLSVAERRKGGKVGIHYLPAARSGIMQSHRVIASSLVARSTRAGLERFPELPTFSGVMADFMQRLILYEDGRSDDKIVRKIADALESEALAGWIRIKPRSAGYPEFVYRPHETQKDIRLTRASSMVSELAPVVLFLRGAIDRGNMLIIEEPEAHLHPAAQTQMAVALARMVRAGVRVVVTTHSDWLLKEIGNLMREGELGERTGESTIEDPLPSSLRPSEVGIWLFRKDWTLDGSKVEEIPFDRSEGVEPQDYEDVAEALYNRSAILQNRFEETAASENE